MNGLAQPSVLDRPGMGQVIGGWMQEFLSDLTATTYAGLVNVTNIRRGTDHSPGYDSCGMGVKGESLRISEPSTLLLFGTGLVVMIVYVYRRERVQPR